MRTFFPKQKVTIDASSHGPGAEYLVGVGNEMWGSDPTLVLKVQMSYDGKVAGRKAPSFPLLEEKLGQTNYISCPDFDDIVMAAEQCFSPLRTWMVTWDRPKNGPDVTNFVIAAIMDTYALDSEDVEMPCFAIRTVKIEAGGTAHTVKDHILRKLQKMGAPKNTKIFVARLSEHAVGNV